ncbi:MAG: hypothetical protein KC420_07875 [Myxococcales bacterium]|nr:hypothetical protein [Myxococcales bacterium]
MPPGTCYSAQGECVDGACVYPPKGAGEACDDGDGCTVEDVCDGAGGCGGAAKTCSKPHATGTCVDGACGQWKCVAPWKDCDGDIGNGCEIPVGVPNQCDAGGLNSSSGCWTAYCGASGSVKATNFGTYYCVDCENCHSPQQGKIQWCDHSSGEWFTPPADGACGSYLDKVCGP